jgi:hypothetical protein
MDHNGSKLDSAQKEFHTLSIKAVSGDPASRPKIGSNTKFVCDWHQSTFWERGS